jgi:NitT/TauT family transport system ATP-binding protein
VLSIKNVSFAFSGRPILDDVSLDCQEGETLGILGRSGGGKTTLLNLIAGVLPIQQGTIAFNGETPASATSHGHIGYIFQSPTLMPWLTVAQNIELALAITGRGQGDGPQLIAKALKAAHIEHAAERLPGELSGGMQTRAAIARALSYGPRLLLADEPFAALDDVVKDALYSDFQDLTATTRMSTVLVTHNLNEALLLADRIVVLSSVQPGDASVVKLDARFTFRHGQRSEVISTPEFGQARNRLMEALR